MRSATLFVALAAATAIAPSLAYVKLSSAQLLVLIVIPLLVYQSRLAMSSTWTCSSVNLTTSFSRGNSIPPIRVARRGVPTSRPTFRGAASSTTPTVSGSVWIWTSSNEQYVCIVSSMGCRVVICAMKSIGFSFSPVCTCAARSTDMILASS